MTITNKAARICSAGAKSLLALVTVVALSERAAAQDEIHHFDIGEQKLTTALLQFSEQSDTLLVMHTELIADRSAPEVKGDMPAAEALEKLLEGSGLEYSVGDDGGVTVVHATQTEDSNSGKVQPTLMAQASADRNRSMTTENEDVEKAGLQIGESIRGDDEGAVSVITGKVTDARTGANLKGALVTIEETGQWTSTGDLGRFRFASVPSGSVTLTVSFLGYAGQSAVIGVRGDSITQDFALRGGSEIEEIVVYGQRSARALALNQERTAENSATVLSSDLLGQFGGATLSESLRRAPGVAFQVDSLSGDGTNVIIRGLAPDLNQITLDGQRLADGSGVGRSPAIGNLLTSSIDQVTISKTLLPSQDSSGSGGLIEIKTKGPLDQDRRFARISAEGTQNDGFRESQQYSATVSGTFGEQGNFGVSASMQFRRVDNTTVSYRRDLDPLITGFGEYLPLADDGSTILSVSSVDPRRAFPFEPEASGVYPTNINSNSNTVDSETTAGTLTLQWVPVDHTNLRISYTRTDQDTSFSRRLARFQTFGAYEPLPISELGGEVRGAYVSEDIFADFGAPGIIAQMFHEVDADDREENTDVFSFQGKTSIESIDVNYRLSQSRAERSTLDRSWSYRNIGDLFGGSFSTISRDLLLSQALQNTVDGRVVSVFAPIISGNSDYQLPLLTEAGYAFYNDPNNYAIGPTDGIRVRSIPGENDRQSAAFSIRKNFSSDRLFQYLEIGAEYEKSRFDFFAGNTTLYRPTSSDLTTADFGVSDFRADNLSAVGVDVGFLTPTAQDLNRLFASLGELTSGAAPLLESRLITSTATDEATFTDEEELAIYLQGRFDLGDFEIIGGVRFSRVDLRAKTLSTPILILENGTQDVDFQDDFRQVVDEEAAQTAFLPRILVNYRPSDRFVIRGGYFQSVARPRVTDLTDRQFLQLDLQPIYGTSGNQPQLTVFKGNPDLKSSITHSYDLSASLYDDAAGVLQVSVFYKDIEDFVEFTSDATSATLAGVILPEEPRFQPLPSNLFVEVTKPTNNDKSAEIWGFELVAERQFTQLPGAWSGLGVYANYTYSDSTKFFVFNNVPDSVSGELIDVEVDDVPFDQSPKHSGTFAVTYNKDRIDASIAYTAQSERLSRFLANDLSEFQDEFSTLDFRVEYQLERFGPTWRVWAAGSDLLKGKRDPDTLRYVGGLRSDTRYYNEATFFGGRTFSIGFSGVFQ